MFLATATGAGNTTGHLSAVTGHRHTPRDRDTKSPRMAIHPGYERITCPCQPPFHSRISRKLMTSRRKGKFFCDAMSRCHVISLARCRCHLQADLFTTTSNALLLEVFRHAAVIARKHTVCLLQNDTKRFSQCPALYLVRLSAFEVFS